MAGRFSVAFDDPTLKWDVTWTALDQAHPNLVTSYQIDRGRQYELDRTDTGRATVEIADPDGILDPTNPSSPYVGKLEPLLQAKIARRNPVDGNWYTRFRGWIDEYDYSFDPSQRVNRLTLSLVDIFEILSAIEMRHGYFGVLPPTPPQQAKFKDQCWFETERMDLRIQLVLDQAITPTHRTNYCVVFSGNVNVMSWPYSPGENPMTVVQEAADAEFPGVSNVYTDRLGRLCVHGRLAKFDPAAVIGGTPPVPDTVWDYHEWKAGDGAAVQADTSFAHIRRFAYNRGLSKIINHAYAAPVGIEDSFVDGQLVKDDPSIGNYGYRSWSAENLLTYSSLYDGAGSYAETKRFAKYYVDNYKAPQNRITDIAFRSMRPGVPGAGTNWLLLSKIDVADLIRVTVGAPGGGGFSNAPFYVEGVHETCQPLNPDYDDVTLSLDLSPKQYFDANPWPPL